MQGTEAGQGAASCARGQHGPDGAVEVVIACDRCDDDVTVTGALDGDAFELARAKAARFATLSIGSLVSQPKVLRLCPECVRAFRLFMLGATERTTSNIGERWESVVSGAV